MLAYNVPDEGAPVDVDWLIRAVLVSDQPILMRLFVNDIIPQRGVVLADFTEATFPGYSQQVLERSQWGAPVLGADHVVRVPLSAGPRTMTPLVSDVTIYGAYLVAAVSMKVVFCRRFQPPRVTVAGFPLRFLPVITLRSDTYDVS